MRLLVWLSLFLGLSRAAPPPEWVKPIPAFRMVGNVYYVGTDDLASYLIATPQGHILINSGLRETVPQIKAGVEQLGFRMNDVKIITATHAHWDHVAGLADLKRMTGGQVWMMAQDAPVLESGGRTDFRFGHDPSSWFPSVHVDKRFQDGDTIALGGTILTAHLHPGHTKGATSFTFDVADAGETYRVGIMNMGSINPGVDVNGMATYPQIREDYARTFRDQKSCRIQVFLASHASQFHMHDKYKPGQTYHPATFVDPELYQAQVARLQSEYEARLKHD